MNEPLRKISTTNEFLAWLLERAASHKVKRSVFAKLRGAAIALVDLSLEKGAIPTSPELMKELGNLNSGPLETVSKIEREFYREVTRWGSRSKSAITPALLCCILGCTIGHIEFWIADDDTSEGMSWPEKRAARLGVEINVPLKCWEMSLCLDWLEAKAISNIDLIKH